MRTTVNIDDGLLRQARELALRDRRPLGHVVDDALTLFFERRQQAANMGPVELRTYGGSGLQPGVDLEDKEALAALFDGDGDHQGATA